MLALNTHLPPDCRVSGIFEDRSISGSRTRTKYTYDAANRLQTAGGVTYTYDGDGARVKISSGTLYWGSGPLAESDLNASATSWKEYVFFDGQRIARRDAANGSVHYYFSDRLGSTSVITDSLGTMPPEQDLDYFPYGGIAFGTSADHYLFAGKERDATGFDYFGARYYGSNMGRFLTIDPSSKSAILELPQSWNRYSYVYNRPTFARDSDGRCPPCIGALVGGTFEGAWNLGSQLYQNGGNLGAVSWREVGANAAGGAVAGAIAGATGGASLLVDVGVGGLSNVTGGIVTRTVEGKDASEVFSPDEIEEEAASGFAGGAAGHLAAHFIHVPDEPELPGPRRHAVGRRKLLKYDAAVAARNSAERLHTGVHVGVHDAASRTGVVGFWHVFDWIFTPPPPPPPPTPDPQLNPHSTSTIISCSDLAGAPCAPVD